MDVWILAVDPALLLVQRICLSTVGLSRAPYHESPNSPRNYDDFLVPFTSTSCMWSNLPTSRCADESSSSSE